MSRIVNLTPIRYRAKIPTAWIELTTRGEKPPGAAHDGKGGVSDA
jgi:hypothetical protein